MIGYTVGALLFQETRPYPPEERLLRMMSPSLVALLEAALTWVSAGATIYASAQPGYAPALVLSAFKHATVLTLCCILSFYYNDLYDFRIVRSFRDFGSRLLQSVGVAFVLLATCYAFLPAIKIPGGAFGIGLMAMVAVLIPFRALVYTLMRGYRQT